MILHGCRQHLPSAHGTMDVHNTLVALLLMLGRGSCGSSLVAPSSACWAKYCCGNRKCDSLVNVYLAKVQFMFKFNKFIAESTSHHNLLGITELEMT